MVKTFVEYDKPDGKWGWFHYYNPIKDDFAYKRTFEDDNIVLDNLDVWIVYQKLALTVLFGDDFDKLKEKHLTLINSKLSSLFDFVNKNKDLRVWILGDFNGFASSLYSLILNDFNIKSLSMSKQEIAALLALFYIDIFIRDCKFTLVEDFIYSSYKFNKVMNIVYPDFDFEKTRFIEFGKRKGSKIRERFLKDFEDFGLDIFDNEFKYEARISVIMEKYKIGETTAKKYYSMIKDRL